MAVTLKVIGNGNFQGAETNIADYSVTEDATPVDPSDSSGGTGVATFTVVEDGAADGTILLRGDTVELEDGSNGRTRGLVSEVGGRNGEVSISAASRLNTLVIDCTMPAFTGTLDGAFRYYLGTGSVTSGILIDAVIGARPVSLPAWSGSLWDHIKRLCVAQQVEISLVSSNVVVRPLRTRIVETINNAEESWSVSDGDLAQFIEVKYYNTEFNSNALIYPRATDRATGIIQVDTSEVVVTEVGLTVSLLSVQQPIAVTSVPEYYTGGDSVYSILDSKGNAVAPTDWTNAGGNVAVAIGADFKSLIITVTGPTLTEEAPYRLAIATNATDTELSLRVVGAAVVSSPSVLTLPTGMPASRTGQIVGLTVDNPFIGSLEQAYSLGIIAAGTFAGAVQKLGVTATVINRKNDTGALRYPTFAEFAADWTGKTFAQFNTTYSGMTYAEFTADVFEAVADDFENQAFGNVAGARVLFREAWYRIRSATLSHDTISYSAERDTLFSDFDSVWSGATYADFNTRMAGKTYEDFGVIPLWR